METLKYFLRYEISNQGIYDEIMRLIKSTRIISGEVHCNEWVVRKIDLNNVVIYAEYEFSDGHVEIDKDLAFYKNDFIKILNDYVKRNGLEMYKD